jgi:hypothetical protein
MKRSATPAAAGAAAWAMVFVCALATGQTRIDMHSQAKNIDFSQATSTRPFPVGSTLPAVCAAGEAYFKTTAPAGRNLYLCTATNIWTPVESTGGTGGTDITGLDNTFTGHNNFSSAASLTVRVMPSKPAAADCDSASEVGRVVLRKSDPAAESGILYLCQSTSTGTAEWKAANYGYGTAVPSRCDPGELFFDFDAPPGQEWLGCVAANQWRNLGGPAVPTSAGAAGKLLGTDGSTVSWRVLGGFTDTGTYLIPDGSVVAELDGNNLWTGHQSYPASPTQTLGSSSATITCNRHTVAVSAATVMTLNSAPTIADGSNGQVCVIVNTGSSPLTLQDQDRLASSNLQLSAPSVTIAPKSSVRLMFSSAIGDWIQEGGTPSVHGLKCGAGATSTAGATAAQTLGSYTFPTGELQPGDHLRVTAVWQHLPGTNGTPDSAFRTQLKFGTAAMPEAIAGAASDTSHFSEYWIYVTGPAAETAIQRHFRAPANSFLNTAAAASLNAAAATADLSLQARASDVAGSDDAVALAAYCVEIVKGK